MERKKHGIMSYDDVLEDWSKSPGEKTVSIDPYQWDVRDSIEVSVWLLFIIFSCILLNTLHTCLMTRGKNIASRDKTEKDNS